MQNTDLTEKKCNIIKYKKFIIYHIKIGKEILTFGDIEIENKFYRHKTPIF